VACQVEHERVFKELGARLKAMRKKLGRSQEDMLSFGFSTRHWQQIEAGRPITLKTLLRICDVFEVTPEKLLRGLYIVPIQLPHDPR
jgi:transcriptional regulator with XRE-family HTH domain